MFLQSPDEYCLSKNFEKKPRFEINGLYTNINDYNSLKAEKSGIENLGYVDVALPKRSIPGSRAPCFCKNVRNNEANSQKKLNVKYG